MQRHNSESLRPVVILGAGYAGLTVARAVALAQGSAPKRARHDSSLNPVEARDHGARDQPMDRWSQRPCHMLGNDRSFDTNAYRSLL